MTGLSQAVPARGLLTPWKPALSPILAPWHIACCAVLASGCFYIGPIPTVEYNLPPLIIRAEPENDTEEAVLIGPFGQAVFVLAEDPEGDSIQFTWALSRDGVVGYAVPVDAGVRQGSQLDLVSAEELDGQALRCFVDDGENELVELTWQLEVL